MENIENSESNIQRGRIINVGVDSLPEELKQIITLSRCSDLRDYANRDVFEINRDSDPIEYLEYPGVLLQKIKQRGSTDEFLIIQKRISPEMLKVATQKMNRGSEIMCALFDNIIETKGSSKAFDLVEKYRVELSSILNNRHVYLELINIYVASAQEYSAGKIDDETIESLKLAVKQAFSKPIANNMILYIKGTKEEIERQKNKFLENGSNIFIIK